MKYKLPVLLILILTTGVLYGCGNKSAYSGSPLKIGVLPIEDNLPFYVAEQEGLFQKMGFTVELVPFDSAAERDAAFIAGQIDGEAADIVAAALLKKSGTDVKIGSLALGVTPKEGRFVLLGAPGSNLRSFADLKNKSSGFQRTQLLNMLQTECL